MKSMKLIQTFATVSIAVGVAVLALKYTAYVLTGSVALLSDAIESIVNVATAVVALFAIRWKVGRLFGWDNPDTGLGTRVTTLRDRLPDDLRDAPAGPNFGHFTA